jgi:hypothetical protein
LTLIAGTDFELNEFVYQGVSANNAYFYGFVNAQTPNEVRLTKVKGTVSVGGLLVGANSGLGFLINDARTVLRTDYILDGMLAIGMIGLIIDRVIRYSAKRLMPWSRALNA